MHIVFLDAKTVGDVPNLSALEQFGQVTFYETTSPAETLERVLPADIVITNKVVLDKDIIEAASNLKLICVAATGINNVDTEAAKAKNIPVKNVVGYSTNSVAQLTFALLFHLLNKVEYFNNYVNQGGYSQSDIFTHLGKSFTELSNKRFGIIGLGAIGQQVAVIAQAFGAEVVYYSASGKNTDQPYELLSLKDLLQTSDVVSVHAPLNQYTQNLLGYQQFTLMKPNAILINVGRGGIVHEPDLARALNEGLLGAAGLDVFENEPIHPDNPLLHVQDPEKLVLTPHIAWASVEARTLLMKKVCQNIREFINP